MLLQLAQRAPVQRLRISEWQRRGIDVQLWRLDRIDAAAPGNKLFKLHENIAAARVGGYTRVLSFGGAFSNHIHALALAGAAQGFGTIGVIRGDAAALANPTLRDAAAAGMQLVMVDRSSYREMSRAITAAELPAAWRGQFDDCYVVPEGGANRLGALGCRALGEAIGRMTPLPDLVMLACGTGTTMAGLVAGLNGAVPVVGVAVLKGGEALVDPVRAALSAVDAAHCTRWSVDADQHCGGYARTTPDLEHFIDYFQQGTGVPIEPVYTGKMLYAIHRRIERGDFARGTQILAVHTGGLQGARGFGYRKTQQTDMTGFSVNTVQAG